MSKLINKEDKYTEEYVPYVDISEETEAYVLRAEMPGVGKDGVDISVDNEFLYIEGKVSDELRSIYTRVYRRSFRINSASINRDEIKAHIENGVLELTIPKSDEVKAKKIKVSVS